ncbi:Protein O-mannosyl-transferase 2 [Nosema granulosis]|uniref:Protein O-mannosyl-transferase 2 n=1 Tax=Nosema granulosis TaxID=83296 RepID=A0A9P6L0P3_9MICR|nr:Protein O-mannosyl-transferase 2 [Nosema granulosis]
MKISPDLLFILGFSLLPLIKKGTSLEEVQYIKILGSFLSQTFVYDKSLPMPYIIDLLLTKLSWFNEKDILESSLIILKLARVSLYLIIVGFIYKFFKRQPQKPTNNSLSILFNISPVVLSRCFSEQSCSFGDTYTVFFSAVSIFCYFSEFTFLGSVFLGVALSCSWAALSVLLLLQFFTLYHFYIGFIDKNKNIASTVLNTTKNFLYLVLIPIFIYILSFYISYNTRTTYDLSLDRFSLEFQSSFFNNQIEKCDKVVKNNSIITLINQRYKFYLSVEKEAADQFRVFSSKSLDENCLWVVKKVSYEDGPIRAGEKVRLIHYLHEKALALNKVDDKSKFFNLEITDEDLVVESENEIFRFEILKNNGKNEIEARTTLFKLVNTNTGMDLCVRKLKKNNGSSGSSEMSFYSNILNRGFYIADNKVSLRENEALEQVDTYPTLSFFTLLYEHHLHLFKDRPTKDIFSASGVFDIFKTVVLVFIPLFLVTNHISICRYEKGYILPGTFIFIYLLHLICAYTSYFITYNTLLKDLVDAIACLEFLSLFDKRVMVGFNCIAVASFFLKK